MNWQYFAGIACVALLMVLAFLFGRLDRRDETAKARHHGYEEGKRKGYSFGFTDALNSVEQERLADPFRARRIAANRKAMPRPDSVGPIRVHRAEVRGDHRLPQNQPDRLGKPGDVQKPPRTKLIPTGDIELDAVQSLRNLGTERGSALADEMMRGRKHRESGFSNPLEARESAFDDEFDKSKGEWRSE